MSDTDFEDAVLTNLRRAQERKRLMDEIRAEDEGDQEVGWRPFSELEKSKTR